jgi:uncharacterized protein (TIGR00255 family)
MTAYGRGEYSEGDTTFTAELKSLNSRYRDVILRIPKPLQVLEDEVRSQIISRIGRGRVEVSIQMEKNAAESEYDLELNLPLVRSLMRIFEELNEQFGLDKKIAPETLCQMRDVILYKTRDVDIDEARRAFQEALRLALDSLDKMRAAEGQAIEKDFQKRLKLIEEYLNDIDDRAPTMAEAYQRRLLEKMHKISQDIELDEGRLMQEVAIFADRCDITEEIVRLRSHFRQFKNYMSVDDSIGRRLDFLIQEINREVNTISSKTFDSTISAKVIEIKGELEKLREQVQNVE